MVNRVGITGIFLVSGGVLFFLSYVLDLIYKSYGQQGQLEYLFGVLFSLLFAAVTLLGIGLWRLRAWKPPLSRAGRVGLYLSLVALAGFGVTAAAMLVSAVQTSQPPPEDIFWFFFLGLVLSVIGPILLGVGLRQVSWLGLGRLFPFAVAAGAILAPFDIYPWHDIGLMVLGLSWAALGASMLLQRRLRSRHK